MTKEELEKLKYALNTYGGGIGTTDALDLIAEIERLQSEREWRDISTAPDDGTEIILLVPGSGARLGWYGQKLSRYGVNYGDNWGYGNSWDSTFNADPTHWMPLPSASEGGKE